MKTFKEILEDAVKALEEIENLREDNCIRVWRFEDAPEGLRKLSMNGGDEDWLALVPEKIGKEEYILWLDVPAFGRSHVEVHAVPGYFVFIGCHA